MKKIGTLKISCPNCDVTVGHMLVELDDRAKVSEVLNAVGAVVLCEKCFEENAVFVQEHDFGSIGIEK